MGLSRGLRSGALALGCATLSCFLADGGPKSTAPTPPPACARRGPARVAPLDATGAGSTIAVARFGDRTLAYVADEDDHDVHTVDVDSRRELATTPIAGTPSQLLVTKDGRLVVLVRDQARAVVLEPAPAAEAPLDSLCAVDTPDEPVSLAMTPDEKTLLVSTGWGHSLTGYDAATLGRTFDRSLPREPRGVMVSTDGSQAFVTHAVGGQMSVVDLTTDLHAVSAVAVGEQGDLRTPARLALVPRTNEFDDHGDLIKKKPILAATPRQACQGFAIARSTEPGGRILAPEVLVDTGDPTEHSNGYGNAARLPTELPTIAVLDDATREPLEASLTVQVAPDRRVRNEPDECLLPRAAAVDTVGGTLLVACLGIDSVIAYDAASAQPANAELRRWDVASGPTGIAVDAVARRSVVWSQYDRTVTVLSLGAQRLDDPGERPTRISLSRLAQPADDRDLALGRELFHRSIARDGRACASCHPDGRDDGLVWATPDGTRQTPSLAGRLADTAPYAWNGSGETIEAHLANTFARLNAQALGRRDLDALVAYAMTMAGPTASPSDTASRELARGREIFHASETGCSGCHGLDGQAPDGLRHALEEKAEFDTPSLRFVSGTAPYFHDGRFASFDQMLAATDGSMGKTSQLSAEDKRALETYLRSL